MLPVGPRKTLKVYGLTSHPTQPGLIAASASSGLALLCLPHPVAQPAAAVFEVQVTYKAQRSTRRHRNLVTIRKRRGVVHVAHTHSVRRS